MPILLGELSQGTPACPGLVLGHQVLQCRRPVPGLFEVGDQTAQDFVQRRIAHEIQPGYVSAVGLGLRKGRMAADHRLLHEHHQMPRDGTPWRGHGRYLLRVSGRVLEVDLQHGRIPDHLDIGGEPVHRPIHAQRSDTDQPGAHVGDRFRDPRIVGSIVGVGLAPPPVGQDKGIEKVGDFGLGPVLERRSGDFVDQLHRTQRSIRHRPQRARAGLRLDAVGRNREAARLALRSVQGKIHTVGDPARVVGNRHQRRIADRRPDQSACRVRKAPDRIPRGLRFLVHTKAKHAVPRIVLEFHRPNEDR